jgi:hypothetical protein
MAPSRRSKVGKREVEREGPAVMAYMCERSAATSSVFGFRHGAARWNEKVRIDPLKLPPRADSNEPHSRGSARAGRYAHRSGAASVVVDRTYGSVW